MKTLVLKDITIEIDFDENTGRISDTVVSNEDGIPLRSKPFNISQSTAQGGGTGVMIIINPSGKGWKKYVKE